MRILLTGGSGMVGSNIIELFEKQNYEIISPDIEELNLLNADAVSNYLSDIKPDLVIHAAGIVGGIQANIAHPVKFLVDNIQMGVNVIMAAREIGIEKLINLGSSCMYPKDGVNPLKEESVLSGALESTNEGYAIAKIASARLCEYITREDSTFDYKTVIPCNLYGRYDKFDENYSHMIPAVIRKIYDAKQRGVSQVHIWGDGSVRREFMYAGDLAKFLLFAIENYSKVPGVINVGLGRDYTINEYYSEIAKVIGYTGDFVHDLSKPVGMKQKLVDVTKLKSIGWEASTELQKGIRKTFEYYLSRICDE